MLISYKNIRRHWLKKVLSNINTYNKRNGMNLQLTFKIVDFINSIN